MKILLAPNGNPSNLPPLQYNLVRTPAFKAWFGDWEKLARAPIEDSGIDEVTLARLAKNVSKIVDENGEPMFCWHGTNEEFYEFRDDVGHWHDEGFYGNGFYFTFGNGQYSVSEAAYYGRIVKGYFIQSYTPFDFSILSKYKGKDIRFLGTNSLVFLYNVAKMFPEIANEILLWQNEKRVSISIIPDLIEKYQKQLKLITSTNSDGEKVRKGYLESKTEIVEYDYTSTGGKKGSYERIDFLGECPISYKDAEVEILLIEEAIKRYDGISPDFHPEGYMTRFPQITEAIKRNHDSIMQSRFGDEIVVFKPTQIKLADGTNTTFDGANPDIRFSAGGSTTPLLAPNGQPSNLNEVQYKLVRTPAFKAWFGDWEHSPETASKVVDENGEPRVIYHGTNNDFTIFKKSKYGSVGKGIYFTTYNSIAENHGSKLISVFAKIVSEKDGIIAGHEVVLYKPQNIKLADGTNTTFNGSNPDIRFALGGTTTPLLATNGKPSNLNEVQYKLVRTPAFKAWFGDWENARLAANVSKIVDENGEPMLCWHGSDNMESINIFNSNKGFDYSFFSEYKSESRRYITDFERSDELEKFVGDALVYNPEVVGWKYKIKNPKKYYEEMDIYYDKRIRPFFINSSRPFDYHKLSREENIDLDAFLDSEKSNLFDVIVRFVKDMTSNFKYYLQDNDIDENISQKELLIYFLSRSSDDWWILETPEFQQYIKSNGYDSFVTHESGAWNIAVYNPANIKLADGTNTTFDGANPEIRFSKGGNASKTPAPLHDRVYGSNINAPSSAESANSGNAIELSESLIESIEKKLKEHNIKFPESKITLPVAKAVVRRGMGAYSVSHRPTIKGGKPNSRVAWGLARLNAFIYKVENGNSKSGRYSQDNDLLDDLEIPHTKFENGGDADSIYDKWKSIVNMTAAELEKFYNSEEGKEAGLKPNEAKDLGIHYGRESARWIIKMKRTPVSEWTPTMWEWAKRQINFNTRMLGNKGPLYDDSGRKTRKHTSLLIWGHNPEKFDQGGSATRLLAPNGKPSNLNEVQYRLVRTPAFKKWFGDWENDLDNSSQVVDANGEPLVVWHGSVYDFNFFDENKADLFGWHFGTKRASERAAKVSIKIREDKFRSYKSISPDEFTIKPFFLNIRRPYEILDTNNHRKPSNLYYQIYTFFDDFGIKKDALQVWQTNQIIGQPYGYKSDLRFDYYQKKIQGNKKYDGFYYYNKYEDKGSVSWIAHSPTQIKLADGSNTTFEGSNPDIYFSQGGSATSLAPNGRPSNLNEFQYRLVRTPAFKKWFGDWENDPENSSNVVDVNGEPLVVWHISGTDFPEFKRMPLSDFGFHFGTKDTTEKIKEVRSKWTGEKVFFLKPFFLNIRNILSIPDLDSWNAFTFEEFKAKGKKYLIGKEIAEGIWEEISASNFDTKNNKWKSEERFLSDSNLLDELVFDKLFPNKDGWVYKNVNEGGGISFAVIDPKQIKLADGSNDRFGNNSDTRYKTGGELSWNSTNNVFSRTTEDGKIHAFVENGLSEEELRQLVKDGKKFDMIFLDIAYFSRALIGGNRGIKSYSFIYPPEFRIVMDWVKKLLRTENSHCYLMLSGAASAQKDMQKYLEVAIDAGLKFVKQGGYTKLFANGKPVTNVRGEIAQPERLILLTISGRTTRPAEVNFKFLRPKGYQSEKAVGLLRSLIEQSTMPGEWVLDPFAGSGVAGEQCILLGRNFYLIEKIKAVVDDIILPRLDRAFAEYNTKPKQKYAQPTLFEDGGLLEGKKLELKNAFAAYKDFMAQRTSFDNDADIKKVRELGKKVMDLKYELRKPIDISKLLSMEGRKSAIPPEIVVVAREELLANKKIFDAIHEAAQGVKYSADTAVDDIVNGKNPDVSAIELYNAFDNTRKALKNYFGEKIILYRAQTQQKDKATQNWASTRENASQFGDNIVRKEIDIVNIVAFNTGFSGNYEEFIVADISFKKYTKSIEGHKKGNVSTGMKQIETCIDRAMKGERPLAHKYKAFLEKGNTISLYHYHHLLLIYDLANKKPVYTWHETRTDKRGLNAAVEYLNALS